MTLKMYKLNLASRQLITNVLSNLTDVSGDIPHKVRTIRKTFELKRIQDEVDDIQDSHDDTYREEMEEWAKIDKKYREAKDGEPAEKPGRPPKNPLLSWDDLVETKIRGFTIDEIYANWLLETIKEHDWTKGRDPKSGQDVDVRPSIDQLAAIADLQDALIGESIERKEKGK